MIGTGTATAILVATVFLASLLGIAAGGLVGMLLRQPWSPKVAATDAVIAVVVMVIALFVVSAVDDARGVFESRVALVLSIGTASSVLRHLFRPG